VYGEPFTQFRSDVSFLGQETDFNNVLLAHNGAQLTGSAAVNPEGRFMRFDLHGTNVELANFRRLEFQGFPISGRVDFHASGSGTRESPAIQAQLTVRKPAIKGETFGDLTAAAETRAGSLVLHADTSFQNAAVHVDGELGLSDNLPGQVAIKFDPLDFEPLIGAYFGLSPTGRLIAQGSIQLNGPMASPRSLSIAANVDQLSADIENIKLRNDGPVRFSVKNREVHVDQFHLVGDQTDLSLHGDADFGDTQSLNVRAEGKAELKLLQTLDPNIRSSGLATLQMRVEGTVHAPRVRGRMDIANGAISVGDLPNGLTQIHGRLTFAQDRLQINSLQAHTGGGDLDLAGFIAYRGGLYFEVTATGNDIRIRYPPGLSASISASLRYTGSAEASLISGNATLVRLAVDPRFDFAQYLAQARSTGRKGPANPFLENMRLDVHVVSPPELRVDTSLAKVAGDVDLRIRGTAANPAILGRVNIAEGNVSFNGTKYRLQRGDVTFSNPQMIQPIINVELAAHVRDFDITIGFHGPIDRLNITYSSEPPMSSSDIIALLAFGRTKQQDVYGNGPINNGPATLTTSDTVLEQALTTASSSRVQKLFGVGSVKIDPQVIGPENNLGPRVTIEQQIQNNITLTYLTNVAQSSSEQVIQVEYNLTRSVSILAVRDENGILTLEVRIKKRKR
jgi:translocation and assembly module TamB